MECFEWMKCVYVIKVFAYTYYIEDVSVWIECWCFSFFLFSCSFTLFGHFHLDIHTFFFSIAIDVIVNVIRSGSSWHAWDLYLLTLLFSICRLYTLIRVIRHLTVSSCSRIQLCFILFYRHELAVSFEFEFWRYALRTA